MQVGTLEIQLLANMARLQSDMEKAQRTVSGAVGKINNLLGAIGVGISVDFLLGLATKANEYSKSLAALSTQISGTTGQIKELDAASRNLSVQFGTSAIKQSSAFYEILSAGITDTAQATALLTEANRLAIGGNADLMISVDGLTSIIKGYGSAAGTAAEIADTMFTASLAGKLSIQELSENIGKVIPLATTMSVSLEEVTAAISALTLGGISAKESITGVRAILAAVAKPSSEAAKLAKEIGLEFNSAGVQALGLAGFLEQVRVKTQGSADKMAILFGGVESLIPALALTGNAGVEFSNILGQMANKAGATEEAFNKMAASPGFQWDKFMATMSNIAITLGDALANVLTPAAEMAAKALNKLFGFNNVTGIEKQVQLVNQLTQKVQSMADRKHIPVVGGILFDKKEFDLLEHQLEMAKVDLAAMQQAQQTATVAQKQSTAETIKNTVEIVRNNEKKTQAANISRKLEKSFNIEVEKLKQYETEAKRARDITDSVATKQERYNRTLEELERLKPYLSVETYNRALQKAQDELRETATVNRTTVNEMDQLWVQAGRNIQTTLSNSIFDFVTGGFDDMVRNAKNAVLRIMSEFAGLKLAQSIGLGAMFAIPGTAAATGGAGGIGGTGAATAINAASLGTSALSLYKSGFGLPSLIGGGIKSVGSFFGSGSMAAFGGGFAGDALGGLAAGGFGSGAASAASMGASMGSAFAAAAGPLLVAFAATQGFNALAGDKRLGGGFGKAINTIGDIPVIGDLIPIIPILNGLFGRGPLKFKEQSLVGNVTADGFTGALVDRYKASGGLLRGSKTDNIIIDTVTGELLNKFGDFSESGISSKLMPIAEQRSKDAIEIGKLMSESFGAISDALKQIGADVGISTAGLQSFNHEIKLVSESGKAITEEQLSAEIEKVTDALARSLVPEIDQLAKHGETAYQAISRLGQEFNALVNAGVAIGGTLANVRSFLQGTAFDQRTAFIEAAGGMDALAEQTQFFSQNFLTEAERLAPIQQQVTDELNRLGLSSDLTKDQFKALVQSFGGVNGVSQETMIALLKLQPAFVAVRDASESLAQAEKERLAAIKQRDMEERRRLAEQIGQKHEEERQKDINAMLKFVDSSLAAVNSHLGKLKSLSEAIRSATQSISPQSIEDARANILSAINFDKRGNVRGIGNINKIDPASIGTLTNQSSSGFMSTFDFEFSRAMNLSILQLLNDATEKSIIAARNTAQQLMGERNNLPKYATGTPFVPRTGPAIVHKGERIIPAAQNSNLEKSMGNDRVIAAINKLVQKFDDVLQGGDALRVKTV